MSLDWNIGDIKNWKETCQHVANYDDPSRGIARGDTVLNALTQSIIWATMAVGIGEIKEDNYLQFYARLAAWEAAVGPYLLDPNDKDRRITLAEVKAHIGLRTNVFPKESPAKFEKKLVHAVASEEKRQERMAANAGG